MLLSFLHHVFLLLLLPLLSPSRRQQALPLLLLLLVFVAAGQQTTTDLAEARPEALPPPVRKVGAGAGVSEGRREGPVARVLGPADGRVPAVRDLLEVV